MDIRHATSEEQVHAAAHLFDNPPVSGATARFLADDGHHLLIAYQDGVPAGMVTGVEMTHPDKGTEMFLYELAVDEAYRRRGIGRALVTTLARVAEERGCYGMWVLTDNDNEPALATYRSAGADPEGAQAMLGWSFGSAAD